MKKPARRKKPGERAKYDKVQINVRVTREQDYFLYQRATTQQRSVAGVLREILDCAIEAEQAKADGDPQWRGRLK